MSKQTFVEAWFVSQRIMQKLGMIMQHVINGWKPQGEFQEDTVLTWALDVIFSFEIHAIL
jgi:hypothetical protein